MPPAPRAGTHCPALGLCGSLSLIFCAINKVCDGYTVVDMNWTEKCSLVRYEVLRYTHTHTGQHTHTHKI